VEFFLHYFLIGGFAHFKEFFVDIHPFASKFHPTLQEISSQALQDHNQLVHQNNLFF